MPFRQISLDTFRERLSHFEALPQMVVLGLLAGLVSGLLITLFTLAIELPLELLSQMQSLEDYEALASHWHFLLPMLGSALVILLFWKLPPAMLRIGVVHVLVRLHHNQGRMPAANMWVQFVGGAIAMATGHSVGKEGPAIHLGAAASSLLGERMHLPNNALRVLVGCGTAAAIAAAFNTPLAGVIFAMEVVLMEYTIIGFAPVMVAAITGDIVVRALLGVESTFNVPPIQLGSLGEVPLMIILGLGIGLLGGVFNKIMLATLKLSHWHLSTKLLLAGALTGCAALIYPQMLGGGYDSIRSAMELEYSLIMLAGMLLLKLVLSPIICGLGVPAGLIAPVFFIGAMAGGLLSAITHALPWAPDAQASLYVTVGMAAMMSAVLNAPLAGLMALLELTGNPHITLPGMIAIVISNLVVRFVFGLPSIFHSVMQAQGMSYHDQPLAQALSRAGVQSLMERAIPACPQQVSRQQALDLCRCNSDWLTIEHDHQHTLLARQDLNNALLQSPAEQFDLLEIPAVRLSTAAIDQRATLKEALDKMNEVHVDALTVFSPASQRVGLLRRQQLEHYYSLNPKL